MTKTPSAYRTRRLHWDWPRIPLPSLCHACGQWAWQALCPICVNLGQASQDSGESSCLNAKLYVSPWKELITAFKFQEQVGLAFFLAQQLRNTNAIAQVVEDCDYVVPVPLSAQRLRERGFNQALLLAKHLCPQRTLAQGLIRIRNTPAQSGLSRQDRLLNLDHAFVVNPAYVQTLRDSKVVLLDDVTTTGTTLNACTRVLHAAGVVQVSAVVLARTPN